MALIIGSSAIHAAGCYTTSFISKHSPVAEYTGARIAKEEADRIYQDSPMTYLFGIGDGATVIDGFGTAMFINHSCEPNCEADEREGRVWIIALRDIAPGEELTYDYNLYDGDEDEARCNCGSAACRRTMYSIDEIRRRNKNRRASRNGGRKKQAASPPLPARGRGSRRLK